MSVLPSQNPLLEMGEYKFQDLCRELLENENALTACRDYGERGSVPQHGADLIADCDDGISTVIGQCKCYKEFQPARFKTVSTDFLDHLESVWKPFRVKKFILFLGCDAVKTNQQAAIQTERVFFHEQGIGYEVWDKKHILSKLRSHPQIVQSYFKDAPSYWLESICGIKSGSVAAPPQATSGATLNISLITQIGKFSEIFTGKQSEELERIKELHREGRLREAAEKLEKMRASGDEWSLLDNALKAKILKTLAVNALSLEDDLEKAKSLFVDASSFDPEGDHTTFKATLAYYEKGAKAALDAVENPSKTDEFNQKIGFHLELNNPVAALELIKNPPDGIEPDAETKRLHALALFESGKIEDAWVKINQVEEEKPLWEMVKIAKAIIGYYSSVSAAAFPAHPLSWAMPVLWQLVKRDDESVTRLRNAEKVFAQILESGNKHREQKMIFESFRLACLANDNARQDEAAAYFKELLRENPAHPFVLAWAHVRGYDFDRMVSRVALEVRIGNGEDLQSNTSIEEIVALLDIYLRANETKKARRLIEKTRAEFEKVGGSAVYSYWLGRVAVVENKHDEALKIARSEKDRPVGRQIQAMVLRDRYFVQKSNKKAFKVLIGYLEKVWNKTRDRQCLVELCYLNAENGHWAFIAENYEQFVESAGTGDSVRIAAYALNFAKQPTKSLQILEANQNKFPDSILPAELVSLRLKCLTAQGNYSKAVAEAETLHQRENTPGSLLTLIEAQLQKGDVAGIAYNAQKILHLSDVEPKYVLRVAKIAALEDAELAKKLWRRVKDDILDDPELVRDALDIGFAIGLDAESRDLLARMKQYAVRSNTPFTTFSFKETLRQMQRSIKRRNQIDSFYGKGTLPLHFLAGENGFTLATMLHALPEQNRVETDLRRCAKIFVRHGGRSMREGFFDVKTGARLYMDITAFMTAMELGILEKVEKLFAPVRVPAALPNALTAERQKLAGSHQLAEIVIHRRVVTALEKEKFEIFLDADELSEENKKTYKTEIKKIGVEKVSLIVRAKQENSFVVEHLPLSDREAKQFVLPDALAANVINCRVIAQNLLDLGHLNATEFDAAVDKLGIDGSKVVEDEISLPPNAKLYLDDYIVNALEKAELLDKACEHYKVFADGGYIERIKGEIEIFERDEKTARWLQQSEKHLSEGFEKGTYLGISVEERQMFEKSDVLQNVDADSLAELLQLAPQPDAYIWIDDRSVNSNSHAAAIPIVTVTDMLAALQRDGALTEDEYFNHLLKLRAGNYRYIPITSEEILRHLRAAKIVNGKIVESDALSILRRYSAACLLDEHTLQKPPLPKRSPNVFGEVNFALEMTGAVSDAIVAVWNEDEDLREASIRANWIFDNLYVGKYGVRRLLPSNDAADGDGSHEMGIDFSELLAKAIVMHGSQPAEANAKTRRQIYFDWLNDKFFLPRLKADPHAVASAAKMFRSFFNEHPRREYESSEDALASRLINADLFLDLPEQIAAEIKTDEAMLDWLGVSIKKYFTFREKRFLSADFWTAAEKAMNDEFAVVSPADSSKVFKLKRGIEQKGTPAIELVDESTGKTDAMLHESLGILFRDREKRIECLRKNRQWFDCDAETFEREVEEIISLADPRGRVERANSRMRRSIVVYYEHLLAKFETFWNQGKKASMNLEDLETFPPDGLLRHYRLSSDLKPGELFTNVISDSATKLLKEEGLAETVERLSHLPLKIPESVTDELKKLSVEAQSKLFDDLIANLKSPLGKMHLVDLILRSASGDEKLLERAKILAGEIFDDEQGKTADFDLFTAILRFVGEEFGYLRETEDWAIPVKLAVIWAHAGKLFNLLLPIFGNSIGFRRWFWNIHQHTSTIFGEKSEYLHDCLHPRRISDPVFYIHGATALWAGNAKRDLEFLDAFERIRKAIVFKDEIPQLELFRSLELSRNSTDSIFGGDRSEIFSRFFGEGSWDAFSNDSIKKNIFEALETLEKNQCDPDGWLSLSITVGNSPINVELRGKFIGLIESLNFSALLDADLETAIKALLFIVPQTSILNDELKEKCESWLFQLTKKIADDNVAAKNRVITEVMIDYGYKLLEIALTLSFRTQDAQSSGKKFKELMLGLLNVWKELGAISETAIETLTLSLPLAQTQYLPEILLNIRASKPANLTIESVLKQKIDDDDDEENG